MSFYTDPSDLPIEKTASIFFRKDNFNAELNLSDRQQVNKIEQKIANLSALTKLTDYKLERSLPIHDVNKSAAEVAYKLREQIFPQNYCSTDRDFLKALIDFFAQKNILVFEFADAWNKKIKTSIDGFFISAHTICIKRLQGSYKREIFTLAHELGHYLLDKEELDKPVFGQQQADDIEKWCTAFAFAFLMGEDGTTKAKEIDYRDIAINDTHIKSLSEKYHISRLALFTHLAITHKITWQHYQKLKESLDKEHEKLKKQAGIQREQENKRLLEMGKKPKGGGIIKLIYSELEKYIYRNAFLEGVVDEYDVLNNFKEKDIDKLIYG